MDGKLGRVTWGGVRVIISTRSFLVDWCCARELSKLCLGVVGVPG